jgi:hypothetical protein
MTIEIDIGKFKAKLEHDALLCRRGREVELDVTWSSCGVYVVTYSRPRDADPVDIGILVKEEWYPDSVCVSFTPEQFEKVCELFPSALKQERNQCYKPFYEDYDLDRGMMDFGMDGLFQAFKDYHLNVEKVYLVNHMFARGAPTSNSQVLGLHWEDFKILKDLIESKKGEIFYSGCKVVMPSKLMSDLTG